MRDKQQPSEDRDTQLMDTECWVSQFIVFSVEEKSFGYQFNFYLSTGEESIPAMGEINPKSGAWFRFFLEDSSTEMIFFFIFVVVFSITSKGNFMSRSRFNKLRFNIGLLPKLWSYFKQIWKERRSYNFYSFYGHWVTSFLCWVKDVSNIYFSGFPSLGQQCYSKTGSW